MMNAHNLPIEEFCFGHDVVNKIIEFLNMSDKILLSMVSTDLKNKLAKCTKKDLDIRELMPCASVDLIEFVCNMGLREKFNCELCLQAASHNKLDILKWAKENNFPWNKIICIISAENFRMVYIQKENDCTCDDIFFCQKCTNKFPEEFRSQLATICDIAAYAGHLEILVWTNENGLELTNRTINTAAAAGHIEIMEYCFGRGLHITGDTCEAAAEGGHLHVLKWIHEKGIVLDLTVFTYASGQGHLEILKWLHANNFPHDPNKNLCSCAARGKHFETLKWLYSNGHALNEETCLAAAWGGDMEIIQWLYHRNCPWDTNACTGAASSGHLDVLVWLRNYGCPWNERTVNLAVYFGRFECLKWALENGCPHSANAYRSAVINKRPEIAKWLCSNGYPHDHSTCDFCNDRN